MSLASKPNMANEHPMSHSTMMLKNSGMNDCCEQQCQCPTSGCFVSALLNEPFFLHLSPLDNVGDLHVLSSPNHSTEPHFRPPALTV